MKMKEQRKKDDTRNNPKEDDDLNTETIEKNENPRIESKTHHQDRRNNDRSGRNEIRLALIPY